MGLLQQAVKTYDFLESQGKVGKYEAEREPLAPMGHIIATAEIEITIDREGKFITAQKIGDKKNPKKIIIPITNDSLGRSSTKSPPHPLCDKLSYMISVNTEKYNKYLETLQQWIDSEYSDPKIEAVFKYIKKQTIIKDLSNIVDIEKAIKDESFVCWSVLNNKYENERLYEGEMISRYTDYYLSTIQNSELCIDYITGGKENAAFKHPGLIGVLRIISLSKKDFVNKGRFTDPNQACSISWISSQKVHNVLKWVIANDGERFGGRTFICWCPNGKEVPKLQDSLHRGKKIHIWVDYRNELQRLLESYKTNLTDTDDVVIAAFDSPAKGRMSVSYYNELKGSDFLDRLKYWDETCCWYDNRWGIRSPSLYEIVQYTFGYPRGGDEAAEIKPDNNIIGQNMQRLIKCRVDKGKIPRDIVKNIVNKAERLHLYDKKNRNGLLFTACAVIRKFYIDYKKEECEMALETEKKDRSYQYGRLLAVLEKIEIAAYGSQKAGITNALRLQSMFVKRPFTTTNTILMQAKNVYYPMLKTGSRIFYERLIGEIMEMISTFGDDKINRPLSEMYLLGYYLQKNDLNPKNNDNNDDNNDDDEREES